MPMAAARDISPAALLLHARRMSRTLFVGAIDV